MANFKAKARKYVKKQVRRAGKAIKKRYVAKGGNLKVGQIAKDVMMLKRLVNAEKKRTTLGSTSFEAAHFTGQVNGNSSGHRIVDISPSAINQGNGYNERNGNSIKLHSLVIKGQFIQMTNTT